MSCMSLSGVIASPSAFAALPAMAKASRALRMVLAQCSAQPFLIDIPSRRIARKSAHSISFRRTCLSMLFSRAERPHGSVPCAFARLVDRARRRLRGPARALQRHLPLSSATKVGYSLGRCRDTSPGACKAPAFAPRRLSGPCPRRREHPGLSRALVAGGQGRRQVRGMSSRPRMPVSKNLRSL